nr:hypothetical protein [Actinomycetales bacterium]
MRITNARILTGDAVIERGELTLDGGRVTSVRSLDGEAHPASSGTPYARRADDGTRPPSSGTTSGRHDDDEAHPASSGPGGEVVDLGGALVAPGFVDLMVNGGGGVLFNAQPARLSEIVAAHRVLGTTSILPNLITDTAERMEAARAAVDAEAGSAVLGIHF